MASTEFTADVGTLPNWILWICGLSMLAITTFLYAIKLARPQTRRTVIAEWNHPIRRYFFVGPHLGALMLTLGTPTSVFNITDARYAWIVCFVLQFVLTGRYYVHWMYSEKAHLEKAGAPYLLSTVGWLLLAKLAQATQIFQAWGLDFDHFCFGMGMFFYMLVLVAIFLGFHRGGTPRGHPSLFLIIAPAAVASLVLEGFEGGYGGPARSVFGFTLLMFCVLVASGPTIAKDPEAIGVYWAYTFPLAAQATCSVRYAAAVDRNAPKVLAWGLIALAVLGTLAALFREAWHHVQVVRGLAKWDDPIFKSLNPDEESKMRASNQP